MVSGIHEVTRQANDHDYTMTAHLQILFTSSMRLRSDLLQKPVSQCPLSQWSWWLFSFFLFLFSFFFLFTTCCFTHYLLTLHLFERERIYQAFGYGKDWQRGLVFSRWSSD